MLQQMNRKHINSGSVMKIMPEEITITGIPEGAEYLQFLFAFLLGQCKRAVWQGRKQHRYVWDHGQIPL